MTKLYHYTCADGWAGISGDLLIRPHKHPWLAEPLVWLSDMSTVDRGALGLTGQTLTCDRGMVRIPVDCNFAIPWSVYANAANVQAYVKRLFHMPPARPDRWWVATSPILLSDKQVARVQVEVQRAKAKARR